jgi:Icc-related predicted phosphoesterase
MFYAEEANKKAKLEKVDFVVICGDITHFGGFHEAERIIETVSKGGITTIFVPGNCDLKELTSYEYVGGGLCVHGRVTKIDDINFFGVGGSILTPFNTLFEYSEDTLSSWLFKKYEILDVKKRFTLISHNPPYNTQADLLPSGEHVGSLTIRRFIENNEPDLVLCGHIHEAKSIDKINETFIINPGPARWGHCSIIKINEGIDVDLNFLRET